MQPGQRILPAAATGLASRANFRKAGRMSVGRDELLNVLEMMLEPLLLVASLWCLAALMEGGIGPQYMIPARHADRLGMGRALVPARRPLPPARRGPAAARAQARRTRGDECRQPRACPAPERRHLLERARH